MIDVVALTSGLNTPSSRFRIRQHIPHLASLEIRVEEFFPRIEKDAPLPWISPNIRRRYLLPFHLAWEARKLIGYVPGILASRKRGITWLQREMIGGMLTLEPWLGSPLVFDVDDAIWTGKPFGRYAAKRIGIRSDVIFAGNQFIADWFSSECRARILVIPTAIDTERFVPRKQSRGPRNRFVIGWTGVRGNLAYLGNIERALARFMADHRDVELHVLCDADIKLASLPANRVRFTRWHPSVEATVLQEWDIGIMPLPDDDFARGKCSFKMLQYMASGLPVVVSPVGMNAELLSRSACGLAASREDDWYESLAQLYASPAACRRMGNEGRKLVEAEFSVGAIAERIAQGFLSIR